jgi:hypothetical protein
MDDLQTYTTEELEEELERRKKQKEEIPEPLASVDYSNIYNMCTMYIYDLHQYGEESKDFEHYLFECALETIYGKDIWFWINEKLR